MWSSSSGWHSFHLKFHPCGAAMFSLRRLTEWKYIQSGTETWGLTLKENRLPNVGADCCHGVQVGQALLVLLADGQQSTHVPDLMVDVVPSSFGCSFGGSVRDHDHWGGEESIETEANVLKTVGIFRKHPSVTHLHCCYERLQTWDLNLSIETGGL